MTSAVFLDVSHYLGDVEENKLTQCRNVAASNLQSLEYHAANFDACSEPRHGEFGVHLEEACSRACAHMWEQQHLQRRCGFAGARVGEASHPGPPDDLRARPFAAADSLCCSAFFFKCCCIFFSQGSLRKEIILEEVNAESHST